MQCLVKRTLIALVFLFPFSQCHKDNKTFDAYFYANWSETDAPLTLYIDNQYKGDLPYLAEKPTCESKNLKQRALNLSLKSGRYKFEARNQKGEVRSSGKITLGSGKTSTSGGIGGQEVTVAGDCALIGFTE